MKEREKQNGFTLVELLAVIVVLAIIMVIAIPSVLKSMDKAKKASFTLFANKAFTGGQNAFVYDSSFGDNDELNNLYIYDVTKDLDLSNTGDFKGYVLVETFTNKPEYFAFLYNSNYALIYYNMTKNALPGIDDINPKTGKKYYVDSKEAFEEAFGKGITSFDILTEKKCAWARSDDTEYNSCIAMQLFVGFATSDKTIDNVYGKTPEFVCLAKNGADHCYVK